MNQLLPLGERADPIADTWERGLIATALEKRLAPLCWHIEHSIHGSSATGYVTVTRLHQADTIRATWANHLGLKSDQENGYIGHSAGLQIALPDVIDPDEHCQACGQPFDPRSNGPAARYDSSNLCRSCAMQ